MKESVAMDFDKNESIDHREKKGKGNERDHDYSEEKRKVGVRLKSHDQRSVDNQQQTNAPEEESPKSIFVHWYLRQHSLRIKETVHGQIIFNHTRITHRSKEVPVR